MTALALPPIWQIVMNAASRRPAAEEIRGKFVPSPHARRRPNLTISMLQALKAGFDHELGHVAGDRGVKKALVCRNLAAWHYDGQGNETTAHITEQGKLLIQTQYESLKAVLPDNRTCAH
jgi:hypothetical protein